MDVQGFRSRRLTSRRKLVLEIVTESEQHLDAETIFQLARQRDESISLATVYRALFYLKEAGLIQEQRLGEDHGHFESAAARPHYHFVCQKCRRVIELEAPRLEEFLQASGISSNLQITEAHLLLDGICDQCH